VRSTVSTEQNTVFTRTLETASTREQDFRFETLSKKTRLSPQDSFRKVKKWSRAETETETVGSETETETETSKNLYRDVSRPRQCLETIQLWFLEGIRFQEDLGQWTLNLVTHQWPWNSTNIEKLILWYCPSHANASAAGPSQGYLEPYAGSIICQEISIPKLQHLRTESPIVGCQEALNVLMVKSDCYWKRWRPLMDIYCRWMPIGIRE